MAAAAATPETLFLRDADGGLLLVCPCCERPAPAALFRRYGRPPRFAHLTGPVLKCPHRGCGHLFSPGEPAPAGSGLDWSPRR